MKNIYSSAQAVFHNLLILHFQEKSLQIAGKECICSYFPQAPHFESALTSYVLAGQDEIKIEFSSKIPLSLHDDTKEIDDFASFPVELQQALLEFIFQDTLKNISAALSLPLSFLTLSGADSKSYSFNFKCTIADEICFARIYFTENVIRFLLPALQKLPAKKRDLSSLSFLASFAVGSIELTTEEVQNLEIHDVLLPPRLSHLTTEKQVFIKIFNENDDFGFEYDYLCSLNGMELTVLEKKIKEAAMSIENENIAEVAPQAESSEVPVESSAEEVLQAAENIGMSKEELKNVKLQLSFELEKRSMTFAEIEELHVGTNILLSCDPLSPVTINISNTAYAKGKIVEIDGAYGVQITEILLK